MNEIIILKCYLLIAFVIAPLMTNSFYLNDSRTYSLVHKISLLILVVGTLLGSSYATFIWPLFCAYGFISYLKNRRKLTECIPFIFSLISSVWLVSGANDWHLLGYNQEWSFYASIHGSFIGWLFVGGLAFLQDKIYQRGCYLAFVFFLLVAFGIDGTPYIKPIGVVGLSIMLPILIGHFAFHIKKEKKLARLFAGVSLGAIILSMSLAVLYEFWDEMPRTIFNMHFMVLTHGLLNALLAIPFFLLAINQQSEVLHLRQ